MWIISWHGHIFREMKADTISLICRMLAFFLGKHDSIRETLKRPEI